MTRRRPKKRLSPSQLPSGMPMTVLMSRAVPLTRSVSVTISVSAGLLRTRRIVSMGYLLTLSVISWALVLDADTRRFTLSFTLVVSHCESPMTLRRHSRQQKLRRGS